MTSQARLRGIVNIGILLVNHPVQAVVRNHLVQRDLSMTSQERLRGIVRARARSDGSDGRNYIVCNFMFD